MNSDRFKNFQDDVKELVLDFEAMERRGDSRYFDEEELETIIDFYLDSADWLMSDKSISYSESLFPASTGIKLRKAHMLCYNERYREAYDILKELERLMPDDSETLYALGVVYSAMNQHRKAIEYYRKASNGGYELWMIYGNIADEYSKMGQLANARNYYRKAVLLNPDDEHSLYELAYCYEDDGLPEEWIRFYSQFVSDHPYSKVGWFCLGEAYASECLFEKAVDAYQYAITIDADFKYAYEQLASCYCAMTEYEKAVAALHDAADHTEDRAYVYYRIGEIFNKMDNPVTANIYYRKAVHEDPMYAEAWHSLAVNYGITRSYDAAIEAARRALKVEPESPMYLTTLALIYADSGDAENAERIFDCAKPHYTEFEHGWIAYADFLILRNRYDEAIDALTQGMVDCDIDIEFNKRLAFCYFVTNRRNMLFNAVRACLMDGGDSSSILLDYCPELGNDIEVMNIIDSFNNNPSNETNL